MKTIVVLIISLTLIGCATKLPAAAFTRPGVTDIQRSVDADYCDTRAETDLTMARVAVLGIGQARNNFFKVCMMDRGYHLTSNRSS